MRKYLVKVREIYFQDFVVEANNEKEAIELVADGQGDMLEGHNHFEYSHSDDTDTWQVEDYEDYKSDQEEEEGGVKRG